MIDDERIPLRLRRALNVESGLNDGIATPIVIFMLAVAASQIGVDRHSASYDAGQALRELGGGIVAGLVVGFAGAALLVIASRHRGSRPAAIDWRHLPSRSRRFAAALAIRHQRLHRRVRRRHHVRRAGSTAASRRQEVGRAP